MILSLLLKFVEAAANRSPLSRSAKHATDSALALRRITAIRLAVRQLNRIDEQTLVCGRLLIFRGQKLTVDFIVRTHRVFAVRGPSKSYFLCTPKLHAVGLHRKPPIDAGAVNARAAELFAEHAKKWQA